MRSIALVALAVLAGCGPVADPAPVWVADTCALALAPDEALQEDVTAAAGRWSVATGCDITIAAPGTSGAVPVLAVGAIVLPPDAPPDVHALGRTHYDMSGTGACEYIQVVQTVPSMWEHILTHEFGHCLGAHGHSTDGVLQDGALPGARITEASLTLVCASAPCPQFVVE